MGNRSAEDETFFVGYEEDGVMRAGGVADASAAERAMADFFAGHWRVVDKVWVCFLEWDGRYEIWDECGPDAPGAEPAWRLVDVSRPRLPDELDELHPNPYYDVGADQATLGKGDQ